MLSQSLLPFVTSRFFPITLSNHHAREWVKILDLYFKPENKCSLLREVQRAGLLTHINKQLGHFCISVGHNDSLWIQFKSPLVWGCILLFFEESRGLFSLFTGIEFFILTQRTNYLNKKSCIRLTQGKTSCFTFHQSFSIGLSQDAYVKSATIRLSTLSIVYCSRSSCAIEKSCALGFIPS